MSFNFKTYERWESYIYDETLKRIKRKWGRTPEMEEAIHDWLGHRLKGQYSRILQRAYSAQTTESMIAYLLAELQTNAKSITRMAVFYKDIPDEPIL